jgi:1-acyl-sn-glycerol-3-phosphate acyltransferase
VERASDTQVIGDFLLGVLLVLGGFALLASICALAAIAFGLLVAPRLGRPLAYAGPVGVLEALGRPLVRLLHRTRYVGFSEAALPAGGFVIIANHGSGLDPLLLQFALRRRVRFMMAEDQMAAVGAALWRALEVLPVRYGPEDAGVLRQAVRHLKEGGVVGIFPERGIVARPAEVAPFAEGVGALVALARVPVALCWIHGPRTLGWAWLDPFVPRRRAVVELVGVFDFAAEGVRDPAIIRERLRHELARRSGWRLAAE